MSVSVYSNTLLNADRKTESQPQTWLVSLAGKFAKDKGIKTILCAVSFYSLYINNRRILVSGPLCVKISPTEQVCCD